MMVTISERFKVRPLKSRMSASIHRFSANSMRKPGIRLGLTIRDFSNDRSMFIRVLLYAVNRQSRESGGLVIS